MIVVKFEVRRSTVVNADVKKVFSAVSEFRCWKNWSPWLLAEPDCALDYAVDGTGYSWDGKIVGSGRVDVETVEVGSHMSCKLTFFKPFRSSNQIRFDFASRDNGNSTEVTWTMQGSLPFFLLWMKKPMQAYIGDDFERGLLMLRHFVEQGSKGFELEFPGTQSFTGCHWIGIRRYCQKSEMGFRLSQDFATLFSWLEQQDIEPKGDPMAIYHKWDLRTQRFHYTALIPVREQPLEVGNGFVSGEIPPLKTYRVKLLGSFHFLPNAWACGIMHGRSKVYKIAKKHPAFECFHTMPDRVDDAKLEATLHFPCK